jgi:DNA-directed RNA polymerase
MNTSVRSETQFLSEEQYQDLLDHEQALEENSMAMGAKRFRDRVLKAVEKGDGATVGAAKRILQRALDPTQQAMEWFVEESSTRRGPKPIALKWVQEVGADVAAYMTGKVALGTRTPVLAKHAALEVAALILDEVRYARFRAAAPQLFEYKMHKFQTGHMPYKRAVLNQAIRYANEKSEAQGEGLVVELEDLNLSEGQRMILGLKLLDLFREATGLVEFKLQGPAPRGRGGKLKSEQLLVLTDEALQMIQDGDNAMEFFWPVFLPMVVPPNPWSREDDGGYRFGLRGKHKLVRSSGLKNMPGSVEQMPKVYAALNAMQNTAWRIHPRILEIVQMLQARGGNLAGLPSTSDTPLPARPVNIDTNEEARRVWRRRAADIHNSNAARAAKAIGTEKILMVAKLMADEESIWFPWNCDFRGRAYPIPVYLSPQGNDLCRGLLQFAEGKPLGDQGAVWLARHGVNCMGEFDGVKLTKLTLAEREAWVEYHTDAIVAVANDPMANLWWSEADEPLQFLAFCFEWAAYVEGGRSREFSSSLAVGIDGSCNGIQHFSAMFRDEVGGKAVNLLPSDTPQDLYTEMAEAVNDRLVALVAQGDELAAMWIKSGLVERKLTKRPSMTFGYGSNRYGFRKQIMEYCADHKDWLTVKRAFEVEEDGVTRFLFPKAASLLASLLWESLQDIVVKAFEGREWFQQVSRVITKDGATHVSWTVPGTGFRVRQRYYRYDEARIKTVLAGKIARPTVRVRNAQIDKVKSANAVSPNIIHSLDAAVLAVTVYEAHAEGVTHFCMIHDSYGTHAADMGVLSRITREAFVRVYQTDVALDLRQQFEAQAPEAVDLPEPPAKGSLDLGLVLAAEYFFA